MADFLLIYQGGDPTWMETAKPEDVQATMQAWGDWFKVLEASGNISPERIRKIKDFGLDVVSAGGLIHQAVWADLSMKIRP